MIYTEHKISLNRKEKTQFIKQGQRQTVTGVVVNEKQQLPKNYRREIRKEIYYCQTYSVKSHILHANLTEYMYPNGDADCRKYLLHLYGRINFALQINPNDSDMRIYRDYVCQALKKVDFGERKIGDRIFSILSSWEAKWKAEKENSQSLCEDISKFESLQTGFTALNGMSVLWQKGDLILVGSRPGIGKTAFALNIALRAADAYRKNICIFSAESSKNDIVLRMLAQKSKVSIDILRRGFYNDKDWERISHAAYSLSAYNISVYDGPCPFSVNEISAELRKIKNPGLVIVDYLQLIVRNEKSEDVAFQLKCLAEEFQVPVVCCSQLNRASGDREKGQPMISDLGANVSSFADTVLLLHRKLNSYDNNGEEELSPTEIIVAKNCHGKTGIAIAFWNRKLQKFYD